MSADLAATRVLVATVLVNVGLAGIVGAWAGGMSLHRAVSPWAAEARRRSWAALRLASIATVAADLLLLWMQAAAMSDVDLAAALSVLPSVLTATHVGQSGSAGLLGLALVASAGSGWGHRTCGARRAVGVGVGLGIGIFVEARSAVSHAGDFGWASVQLQIESAHLLAISVWLGTVGVAAFAVPGATGVTTAIDRCDVAQWIRAVSSTATGALVVIVGTGVFNAWRGVGSAANLVDSAYGHTLLVKVALVAVAVGLGGFNRFRVMPRWLADLRSSPPVDGPWPQRFVRILRIEALVLLAALIAAAVLSSSPLPSAT